MPDPQEMTRGLSDAVKQGLGMIGQGVDTLSEVLRSTDAALKEVDSALTGRPAGTAPAQPPGAVTETEAAERVINLVRQARQAASRAGNAQGSQVVFRFQEALRLLFQVSLPTTPTSRGTEAASPIDLVRMGLRDLRGSMALARLANGSGSLDDLEEVTHFTDALVQRTQAAVQARPGPQPPAEPVPAPAAPARRRRPPAGPRPRRSRGKSKEPANPSAVVFARSMGEEMEDSRVLGWARDLEIGKLSEAQFIDRWSRAIGTGRHGDPEELMRRAKARAVQNGLAPDDPYLLEQG